MNPDRLERAYQTALAALLAERNPAGYWTGELSASALSTATAVSALALMQKHALPPVSHDRLIAGGVAWLAAHQNADGGWGDTTKSLSNISTSMLCRAAFHLTGTAEQYADNLRRVEVYLQQKCGKTPEEQAEAIRARYGKDRTFAVPILTTCALAGLVNWEEIPPLPFELACLPQSWFRFLRLPVVSYALPALIAIGQVIYHHRPPRNPVTRLVRRMAIRKSLWVLEAIQPSSGGFLEATPLTSFVALSLAACGLADHPVAQKAVEFLVRSVRPDGSWAIDSNLSVWVTTLAINALAAAGELDKLENWEAVWLWLVGQQFSMPHPYTGAAPGGWGWTHLPGSVPDGDDTSGALLALAHFTDLIGNTQRARKIALLRGLGQPNLEMVKEFVEQRPITTIWDNRWNDLWQLFFVTWRCEPHGLCWLCKLQNRDGGWPTFCKGWGALPFDRSGTDLTAHALRALTALKPKLQADESWRSPHAGRWLCKSPCRPWAPKWRIAKLIRRGLVFLRRQQRPDGSWVPLWFGNQFAPNDENPVYGTARVLAAYRDLDMMDSEPARR
ncbi:MAG TPA: prenyltransferase/squalene oxidase repeat-containing protein, partial [Gemmataceae bacterium]|nr:prenyltransferase/squalene oxidase repeat-containing protein [Gemmataceae bacterium]